MPVASVMILEMMELKIGNTDSFTRKSWSIRKFDEAGKMKKKVEEEIMESVVTKAIIFKFWPNSTFMESLRILTKLKNRKQSMVV